MRTYKVTKIYDAGGGVYTDLAPMEEGFESPETLTLFLRISDFYDAHLSVGKVISDEKFEELYEKSFLALAIAAAEKIVSMGSYSKKQLIAKLLQKKTDREYAAKAALIMEERGYIDEDSQAERLALAFCRRKYWGKKRIIASLLEKGYEKQAVIRAADLVPREEYAVALQTIIERKYPTPPEDKREKDRRIAALIRLGFSLSEITEAFRESY